MIPRYQRVLYWVLIVAMIAVAALLIRGRQRSDRRIAGSRDESPITAPTSTAPESAAIASASDDDGTIDLEQVTLALPADPTLRARTLLARMFNDFASPESLHPVPAGPAVSDVFLVPLPLARPTRVGELPATLDNPQPRTRPPAASVDQAESIPSAYGVSHPAGSRLAVVNLTRSFADGHPSGIETEQLTLQAVIATLQANFPQVDEVLFLVDGQPRDTLNGHADLSRPYAVADPAKSIHVLSSNGHPQ